MRVGSGDLTTVPLLGFHLLQLSERPPVRRAPFGLLFQIARYLLNSAVRSSLFPVPPVSAPSTIGRRASSPSDRGGSAACAEPWRPVDPGNMVAKANPDPMDMFVLARIHRITH